MPKTPYQKDEAAKFGQEVETHTRKFVEDRQEALRTAAARGYPALPGRYQEVIINGARTAKEKMEEANAKIYAGQTERILKEQDVARKVYLGFAKLDMEAYRADLDNRITLRQAEVEYDLNIRQGDIIFLKAEIDKRQVAIIEEEAAIQHEVNYWRQKAIAAEGIALGAEVELANAKVETARIKLTIIPYLYQVIAAQGLIVAAEQRKATALQALIVVEKELAAVKEQMIPMYLEKAQARLDLAAATTEEVTWRRLIEELGYRRNDLRKAEADAEHSLRVQEELVEQVRIALTKSERQLELSREQARVALTQYEEQVRAAVIEGERLLQIDEQSYRQSLQFFWKQWELVHEALLIEFEKGLLNSEMAIRVANIIDVARDHCRTVGASAKRTYYQQRTSTLTQFINKG